MQDPAARPWICISLCICSCICKNIKRKSVKGRPPLAVQNQPLIEAAIESPASIGNPHCHRTSSPQGEVGHLCNQANIFMLRFQFETMNAMLFVFWCNSQLQNSRMILELCSWAIALIEIQSPHHQWELLLQHSHSNIWRELKIYNTLLDMYNTDCLISIMQKYCEIVNQCNWTKTWVHWLKF